MHEGLAARADAIEAELRRLGWWVSEPPSLAAFESTVAFFGDTMPFESWLQFVLLPRVRAVLAGDGSLPARSMVGAQAVREYDGRWAADDLVSLLAEFDAEVEAAAAGGA